MLETMDKVIKVVASIRELSRSRTYGSVDVMSVAEELSASVEEYRACAAAFCQAEMESVIKAHFVHEGSFIQVSEEVCAKAVTDYEDRVPPLA